MDTQTAEGSIQAALRGMDERISLLQQTKADIDNNLARYQNVRDALELSMQTLTGTARKNNTPVVSNIEKVGKGVRMEQVKNFLSEHQGTARKYDVIAHLEKKHGLNKRAGYQVVFHLLKLGYLVQENDDVVWIGK